MKFADIIYYGIGIVFIVCLFAMAHLAFNEDGP